MDRWEIDLGVEHINKSYYIRNWEYLKIGYCDGDCKISFEGTGSQDPNEIDTLRDIAKYTYLYLDNDSQVGCTLVIYFEEMGQKELVKRIKRV